MRYPRPVTRVLPMFALAVVLTSCTSSRKEVDPTVGSGPTGGGTAPGPAGTGGGGGGGGSAGGGGEGGVGGAAESDCIDVGEPCDGGVCVQVVDAAGTRVVCAEGDACVPDTPCGVDGVCMVVVTADGVEIACADGAPGDPCAADADCDSGICEPVADPAGARTECQ